MNISYSKTKDLKKSKNYFYKRHITGEIPFKKTDAMRQGSAIDCYLTEGKSVFNKKYLTINRRVKDNTYDYQLTPAMMDKVESAVACAEASDAYKELRDHDKQIKIIKPEKIGIFEGVSGILDFLKIEGGKAIITDLKTSNEGDLPKYYYRCKDFGYFTQLAFYRYLVEYKYPNVKEFEYRHLVLEINDDMSFCYPYKIKNERIDEEYKWLMGYFEELKKLTILDFKNKPKDGWNEAREL